MSIMQDVQSRWKQLSRPEQRWLVSESMHAPGAGWRIRCNVIRNLVRGERPWVIAQVLGCSRSTVYRVAEAFLAKGWKGWWTAAKTMVIPRWTRDML